MTPFAALLERLVLTPGRSAKLTLLQDFFRTIPDPDRGLALAAITRDLDIPSVKPAMLRALVAERVDPELFLLSYDFVGDLAETISLIWPDREGARPLPPSLGETVAQLQASARADAPALMAGLLDRLGPSERYALIKLVTGGLRVGVSARLAKQALAAYGAREVTEIEELWHGLTPPYQDLFAWLEGAAPKPETAARAPFRPVMLSTPLEDRDQAAILPEAYAAEWKWDGIRVQAVSDGGVRRLYSRTGDDISKSFPDLIDAMAFEGTLDGELLVVRGGIVAPFSDLQLRLNRKSVSAKLLQSHPAFLRAYDALVIGGEDLRPLPFRSRRARLTALMAALDPGRFDLSPTVPFQRFDELARHRANPPAAEIEGLMLKRWDSAYVPGRPKGPWFKWKKDPHIIDAVLMYAQRGHGKRSSFYSDYTFGLWSDGALVPVGKAYFGFTDEELRQIDRFVRENTVDRYGPVRAVRAEAEAGLVLEVAFEGVNRSARHRSGVAMRFPRISRLRWDKPPAEADRLETLEALVPVRPAAAQSGDLL